MWVAGSPAGQRRECFSRYFLPSSESLISCSSSGRDEGPLRRVLGLIIPVLGELLVLSELDPLALIAVAGMCMGMRKQ